MSFSLKHPHRPLPQMILPPTTLRGQLPDRQFCWQDVSFILVINQLDTQNLFYNKFISCLSMFRAPCAHRQEAKIVLYSIWYHHIYRWPSRAQVERRLVGMQPVHRKATYRCDDTRCCIIQFWPPDDEHMVLETCGGMK